MSARRGSLPAQVHLTIERLVLHGVAPGEERHIMAALRQHLQEAFATTRRVEDFGGSQRVVRGNIGEPANGSASHIAAGISAHIARSVLR
jgi:hypothetical protein